MASKNVETFRAAHQAFNRRDFDAVVATMAENITYQDRARNVTFRGRTGFKEFMQGWVTAFSNAEVFEPQYIDAGNVVIAEFIARGVNDGSLGPLPATGKQGNFPYCEVMRFNDKGQIIAGAAYYDQLSIMVQLGHAQAPQSAAGVS
jgi:steroid delta-isomerase-like uncharacterized protein